LTSSGGFVNEVAIGFQHEDHRLVQIRPSFFQSRPLSVRAWKFLNKPDVSLWTF
jgi:hypothetical protein